MTRIEELTQQAKDLSEQIKTELQKAFVPVTEEISKVAAKHGLQGIGWTAYVPYFNDGDECTFGVGDTYAIERSDDPATRNLVWDGRNSWDYSDSNPELTADLNSITKLLSAFKDTLRAAYGEHQWTIVFADGTVQSREWDHD